MRDPYEILGVKPGASDAEVRAAYRRLVQRHHPDHNNGSLEAARRFEEVQEAYAQVREMRKRQPRPTPPNPDVDARLADLERQVREARQRAQRAAAQARDRFERRTRPSDEELGYVTTDDSFSKILADARSELADWLDTARHSGAGKRAADLVDEVESKLSGRPPRRPHE